ncbi:hypothetical protein EGR_10668 [Echinococcus granulosus]|uniref:Uncharacterized protein n=1 Tax=Echinococcus granulosus TaxID=6210 RepID=W6ULW6_ECHGR|nr:hypothetical protein EGR_10668 [Echinococcus granulosus]EUB54469.1 hypothetical protein EGR_10668 [Echinococcus granulosus]
MLVGSKVVGAAADVSKGTSNSTWKNGAKKEPTIFNVQNSWTNIFTTQPIITFYEKNGFFMLAFITHFIHWHMDL